MGLIISAGCSYAYGYGLEDKTRRYADVIARASGHKLISVAAAGASNEFIAQSAAAALNKALMMWSPDQIVVLVGWTTSDRFEYFDTKVQGILSLMANVDQRTNNGMIGQHGLPRDKLAKNMWSPGFGFYKFLHAFNYINALCKMADVKLINLHNVGAIESPLPACTPRNRDGNQPDMQDFAINRMLLNHVMH